MHSQKKNDIKNNIVVYTALFGDYDELIDIPEGVHKCDFICFTDQEIINNKGWTVVRIDNGGDSNVLQNRKYKILPHIFLPEYEYSIYIDSNIRLLRSPEVLVIKYLQDVDMALPKHFERNCIYAESEMCISNGKALKSEVDLLINEIKEAGFPENYGLAENNIIIRRHNSDRLIKLMESWWDIFSRSGYPKRDQLTLMYLLWLLNIKYKFMVESSRNNNDIFRFKMHKNASKMSFVKRFAFYISSTREQNVFHNLAFVIISALSNIKKKIN